MCVSSSFQGHEEKFNCAEAKREREREREREKKRRERASWKNEGIAPRDVFALVAEREILRR